MPEKFKVVFSKEVINFLDRVEEKARKKILFNIDKSKVKDDPKLFKKLTREIWEFRTLYNKKQYRLFAFWDKTEKQATIVVATHGVIKKSQKTPGKEIDKAIEMMNEYFKTKK